MNKHGNLYWEIEFTAYHGADMSDRANTCIEICVSDYDFSAAYNKARAMYTAATIIGAKTFEFFTIYLRDNGQVVRKAKYHFYARYFVANENINAFFSEASCAPKYMYRVAA